MKIVTQAELPGLPLFSRGKVRDIFEVDGALLLVTTDRMSAFDVGLAEPVPYKGVVLNRLTLFWMDYFKQLTPNHLLAAETEDFPDQLQPYADQLEGRAVLARKASPLPVECVVRGYLAGSGWEEYRKNGTLCGRKLPAGLEESARLDTALFTPSTKAAPGEHDQSISDAEAAALLGEDLFGRVRDLSLALYERGRAYAQTRGLIIADTKFEFGLIEGSLVLIDEVLTPDSSRFWPLEGYAPGRSQPSFDKQYLRDWLSARDWDKNPPAPALPPEVAEETAARYRAAYKIITGKDAL